MLARRRLSSLCHARGRGKKKRKIKREEKRRARKRAVLIFRFFFFLQQQKLSRSLFLSLFRPIPPPYTKSTNRPASSPYPPPARGRDFPLQPGQREAQRRVRADADHRAQRQEDLGPRRLCCRRRGGRPGLGGLRRRPRPLLDGEPDRGQGQRADVQRREVPAAAVRVGPGQARLGRRRRRRRERERRGRQEEGRRRRRCCWWWCWRKQQKQQRQQQPQRQQQRQRWRCLGCL